MTTIAIFFQEADALSFPLNKEKYMRHFVQLVAAIEALGAEAPIVRHQSTYLIDIALVKDQPKIIELNSHVSIWDNAQHSVFASTKEKLAQVLVALGQA